MEFWATSGNDNLQAEDREKNSYQIITDAGIAVCYYAYIRGIFIKDLCLCDEGWSLLPGVWGMSEENVEACHLFHPIPP